jgi:hypothetical protein
LKQALERSHSSGEDHYRENPKAEAALQLKTSYEQRQQHDRKLSVEIAS